MSRKEKDWDWTIKAKDSTSYGYDGAILSVLMDIRDEMKRLNSVLQCPNFVAVPSKLDAIKGELRQVRLNTRKKKRRPVSKPQLRVVR